MMLQPRENARIFDKIASAQFGNLIKNLSSYPEFLEAKKIREGKMCLRGVLDSVHFHRMRKVTIYH
jgi:hypothetical protein